METPDIVIFIIIPVFAYLSGSIPSGMWLTRLFLSKDIRNHGSGNIGATNVNRIAGAKLGLITLLADIAKGAVPVVLAKIFFPPEYGVTPHDLFIAVTALSAFLGHLYPCFLKFNGGKGVATAAGCFLVISPLGCLVAFAVFGIVAAAAKRVSPASLCAALALPAGVWWATHNLVFSLSALVMAGFIFIKHTDNIRRLMEGTEPKFR